ncbi:MAG: hypothetical protein J7L15_09470, partial [Clostridiales bacterium]|nr:hypothetical protein [Clostridiales bacterium]
QDVSTIISVVGHRDKYLMFDDNGTTVTYSELTSPDTLTSPGSTHPRYIRDAVTEELAFISDVPNIDNVDYISNDGVLYDGVNTLTTVDSRIQYSNTANIPEYNIYSLDWNNLDEKDLIAKNHLTKIIADVESLNNTVVVTFPIYRGVLPLSPTPTILEITDILDLNYGGTGWRNQSIVYNFMDTDDGTNSGTLLRHLRVTQIYESNKTYPDDHTFYVEVISENIKFSDNALFQISTTENFTTASSDTWEKLNFTAETTNIDIKNNHFTYGSSTITITSPGVYRTNLQGTAQWSNTETLEYTIYKDGVNGNPDGNPIFEGKGATSVFTAAENNLIITQADLDGSSGDITLEIYFKTTTAQTVTTDYLKLSIEKMHFKL